MTSENYGVRDRSDLSGEHTQEQDETLHDLKIHRSDRNSRYFSTKSNNFYSDKFPIISDIFHVSGGDGEGDFEDAQLAPATTQSPTVE